jgi:hypothetical protein
MPRPESIARGYPRGARSGTLRAGMRTKAVARLAGLLLVLGYVSFGTALVAFLGGSSCVYYGSSCFDDDENDDDGCSCNDDSSDDCDDDGAVAGTPIAAGTEALLLTAFELIPSEEPGAHPARRLLCTGGPSLFGAFGPGEYGGAAVAAFTAAVRGANPDLLGLAPEAGRLVLRSVELYGTYTLVRWAQVPPGGATLADALPGRGMDFLLDGHGILVQVDNTTLLHPGAARSGGR